MDNLSTWSHRAQKLFESSKNHENSQGNGHRIVLSPELWIEWVGDSSLENIFFSKDWNPGSKVMILALKDILKGKSLESAKNLSLRELDAFLRDRNSQPALPEESYSQLSDHWSQIISQISLIGESQKTSKTYHFPSGKVFALLSLSEKIQELKAFFSSEILLGLKRSGGKIELLDVQDFDVFIALDSGSVPESALLDWLQIKLTETYREPSLNLIPESFS